MTGPEHYRRAEQHLDYAARCGDCPEDERMQLRYAAVHAQLALAAVTTDGTEAAGRDGGTAMNWSEEHKWWCDAVLIGCDCGFAAMRLEEDR